jgi:hypothetical protein
VSLLLLRFAGRLGRAVRALFRGDGFDDEAVFVVWVEWDYCSGCGFLHEGADGGLVQWEERPGAGLVGATGFGDVNPHLKREMWGTHLVVLTMWC